MKFPTFTLLSLFLLSLFTGCTAWRDGVEQDVSVMSFPSGASVSVDAEVVGQTPVDIPLRRKLTHQILLQADGYRDHRQDIYPIRNAAGHAFVQFGLLEDFGYYFDLVPNPVEIQMMPSIIPFSRGATPYVDMAEKVIATDERREAGEIGPVEHRYIVERIIEFYTR